MSVAVMEQDVAKAKKNDTTIRLDAETAEVLRKVASLRGVSIAEYVRSDFLPVARRALIAEARKITKGEAPE